MSAAPPPPKPVEVSGLKFIYRALRSRNYRLYFTGQFISLIGNWLTMVSIQWVVYILAAPKVGNNIGPIMGLVGFAGQFPVFLLAAFGGVLVDRFNLHRTLLVTQTLAMMESFALAALALTHHIEIWQIIALNAFQGLINSLDVPSRQSFIVQMVDNRDDLGNAIALNSSMVHGVRLIGPAAAGIIIFYIGAGPCFLVDGFSYMAVLAALLAMRLKPMPKKTQHAHVLRSLKDGIKYAWGFRPIRTILLLVAMTSLMFASLSTLMPIIAGSVLGEHVGPGVVARSGSLRFGALLGCSGVGAFAGSIYLASRRSVLGLGRVISVANALLGCAMIVFSLSGVIFPASPHARFLYSAPLLIVTGGSVVVMMASSNTVLQTIVDDDKRGRVMSLFAISFIGMAPFGNLLAGELSKYVGVLRTLTITGSVCVATSVIFAFQLRAIRPLIRPIYIRKGILPAVVTAVRDTAALTTAADE